MWDLNNLESLVRWIFWLRITGAILAILGIVLGFFVATYLSEAATALRERQAKIEILEIVQTTKNFEDIKERAEKEMEEQRAQPREGIKATKGRRLTGDQRQALATSLANAPGLPTEIYCERADPEACRFRDDFREVFESIGHQPRYGVVVMTGIINGVWIRIRSDEKENPPKGAGFFQKEFRKVGIEVLGVLVPDVEEGTFHIYIGPKGD